MTPAQMQARIAELEAQLVSSDGQTKPKRAPDPDRARKAQFKTDAQERARRGKYINRYYL